MKRRLSVAISLIGDTQVVFLDEPTAGLDPASKYQLWQAIKLAKRDRAMILTTHSMEEAELLCDRVGIVINGRLQCLGTSNELKAKYGGLYLLNISADPIYKMNIERMVTRLSSNATKIYDVIGTQRFQLPKVDIRVPKILEAIENLKTHIPVHAFELTSATLEDVFTNVVAQTIQSEDE
ncbi:ABC transporter A family member 6-like [Typha latifolia]|uniref:ABC transporter A family member 6-like n=1 Tax=Typha latifolia TaxID=4733 RepID=UPI003C306138